ncbi:hypothetical protein Hanom_Chr02g00117321 [Helianthus anomalus]
MGVVGLKNYVSTEESCPQSSEFIPVGGGSGNVGGRDQSMEDEEVELNPGLHGKSNTHSVFSNREVGPELSNQVERESGSLSCKSHEPGKKKKRRSKGKSPLRSKSINVNKSPPVEGRPNKRPRPSSSDPFDLEQIIENWKSLSDASNRAQGLCSQPPNGGLDLNQRATSSSSASSANREGATEEEISHVGATINRRL